MNSNGGPDAQARTTPGRHIVVIGGGIVGISCAHFLQRDGHQVTVVDPNQPGSQTSYGNACSLSMSSSLPTALPGLITKIPGMILDPTGPLNIRWQYLPRLLPFLLGLARNTSTRRLRANSQAIGALVRHVMDAYGELTRGTNTEALIRRNGALEVYENEASFAESSLKRQLMSENGFSFEVLNSDELGQLEPGLRSIFHKALYTPDSGAVTNPGRLVGLVAAAVAAAGGTIKKAVAIDVEVGDRCRVQTTDGSLDADAVVLAAGPWSGKLSAKLGAPVRLEAERGYHIMLPEPPIPLRRFVYFADRKFVLTPHEDGLRMTSGIEYAKVDAPPDYRRIRSLLPHAARVMRDLDPTEQSIWCGNRPTLPDSVPVIGRSPKHRNVFLAFGHSHLGLTLGPVTGRIIADLVADRAPDVDVSAYRPDR